MIAKKKNEAKALKKNQTLSGKSKVKHYWLMASVSLAAVTAVLAPSLSPSAASVEPGQFCIQAKGYGGEFTGSAGCEALSIGDEDEDIAGEGDECTPEMVEARFDALGARLSQRVAEFTQSHASDVDAKFKEAFAHPRVRLVETSFAPIVPAREGLQDGFQPPSILLPKEEERLYPGVVIVTDSAVQQSCDGPLVYSARASIKAGVIGDVRSTSTSTDWVRAFDASGLTISYLNGMGTSANVAIIEPSVANLLKEANAMRTQASAYMNG